MSIAYLLTYSFVLPEFPLREGTHLLWILTRYSRILRGLCLGRGRDVVKADF